MRSGRQRVALLADQPHHGIHHLAVIQDAAVLLQFLERRIAYKLQEIEYRKVDPNLLDRNKRRIESLTQTGKATPRDPDYRTVAGTVLTREYHDKEYRVIVTADGNYDFDGRTFQSLSHIAREITGTRWSGPLFFGLKTRTTKRVSTGKAGQA